MALMVILFSVFGIATTTAQNNAPTGAINGLFTVNSNGDQVYFSQGNLQYRASTNTWRFAENQWDFVGDETRGSVYENGVKCNNALVSSTYSGWIDMFGWGTSGYNHGAVCYQPWSISEDYSDYYAYGSSISHLYEQTGRADWGYNAISNGGNQETMWRSLSNEEWTYLLTQRNTVSGIRYAKAYLNGVAGVVILPDNWDESIYGFSATNTATASYDTNSITLTDWNNVLQPAGVVFLSAAGSRKGAVVSDRVEWGQYWTSSSINAVMAYPVSFSNYHLDPPNGYDNRFNGQSVRLVRLAQANTSYSIETVPNPVGGGTITGAGTYDYYSQVTLTATANEGYTFYQWKENGNVVSTENPYSFVALFDRNLEAVFLENSTYPLLYSYNEGEHTATVIGRWDGVELTGEFVIPGTVMHNGETYTVTAIGDNAFNGCSNLTLVEFPNSLESIGDWAFRYCNGFTSVFIPASVTQIGVNPFTECSNILQITVESGNAYYDSRDNCNAIIETNSNKLISGCLNTIVPSAVTSLGQDAFYIESLTSVTILAETPPTLGTCSFCGVNKSVPVYVPCSSIETYQIANGWSEFTNFIGIDQCAGMVTVTASPEEYGTVTGGGYYENSATCTVTATPNEGYYFLCWMEDGQWVSAQATYTFPVYRERNLTAVFTIGAEKIINGDFEQGNVGFTSGYGYNPSWFNGNYWVDSNSNGCLGHGGTGNFMIIDGATEPGVVVWSEQVSVEPNTYYTFSTWACTLCGPNALLQFSINGTPIGVLASPSQTNIWKQFITTWYSGDSTTATITIVDLNTEGSGNDFGLDDISFREMDTSTGGGDDHAYVDLGLPSGLLWATCNVGADNPEDYGDYFAWGETQPKSAYNWGTYQYYDGSNLTKYTVSDSLTTLLPEDDAATANWGSDWRMPTKEEWQELYQNTTHTWTTQNGVNGRLFTASNGNSLFLPAAGYRYDSRLDEAGSHGYSWSSSLNTGYPLNAWIFDFNSGNGSVHDDNRLCGRSVRAVRSAQSATSYSIKAVPNPAESGNVCASENAGSAVYDFENGTMQGWTNIDADGDGNVWEMGSNHAHNGSGYVASTSFIYNYGALHPDNYLVSPTKDKYSQISFWACAQDVNYASDHFGVAVSTTSNSNAGDFTTIQEWTMTAKGQGQPTKVTRSGNRSQGTWYKYTVDLSAYAGQEIWVAIRHFNCTDWYYLNVDDITLSSFSSNVSANYLGGETCTLTAIPNDGYVFVNWTENGAVVSTDATYTFTVTGSRNLVANFEENYITQTIALTSGWNWWSTNLDITLDDLKTALVATLPGTTIIIKGKNTFITYNGIRWRGTLNTLDVTQMYKINTSASCEIMLEGVSINPALHPITIHSGVNWIGFPLNESKSVSNAFARFAVNGDMVKSKDFSSSYNGIQWRGNLKTLECGKGYVYKSTVNENRIFTFPIGTK